MLYELTYLISPDLNETELKDFSQKIDSLISKSGKFIKSETPKKISLAYPIRRKKEAFLRSCEFSGEPEKLESLKKEFSKENNILRFLLIKKKEIKERIRAVRKIAKREPKRKTELKEIGEKLEKILK